MLRRPWRAMMRNVLGTVSVTVVSMAACNPAPAGDDQDVVEEELAGERPALRPIMLGLEGSSHQLLRGIWLADYELIRSGADGIANHPRLPPEDVTLVQEALGAAFPTFVQYDQEVHRTALSVIDLADSRAPLEGIHTAFIRITESCIGCHTEFREPIRALRLSNTP